MEASNISEASLIILAIVNNLRNSTKDQVLDAAVKSLYLDYFAAAEALDLVLQKNLLHSAVNKDESTLDSQGRPVSRLNLTPAGQQVLGALLPSLPRQVRKFLDQESRQEAKEKSLTANYRADSEGAYIVRLKQEAGGKLVIDLELTLPNENLARQACQNWRDKSGQIYSQIIASLGRSDL